MRHGADRKGRARGWSKEGEVRAGWGRGGRGGDAFRGFHPQLFKLVSFGDRGATRVGVDQRGGIDGLEGGPARFEGIHLGEPLAIFPMIRWG